MSGKFLTSLATVRSLCKRYSYRDDRPITCRSPSTYVTGPLPGTYTPSRPPIYSLVSATLAGGTVRSTSRLTQFGQAVEPAPDMTAAPACPLTDPIGTEALPDPLLQLTVLTGRRGDRRVPARTLSHRRRVLPAR